MAPSSVAILAPRLAGRRYFELLACRLKNAFHFIAGGSKEPMISTGLGGALSAVPTGVPVSTRSPAVEVLESGQRLQGLEGR